MEARHGQTEGRLTQRIVSGSTRSMGNRVSRAVLPLAAMALIGAASAPATEAGPLTVVVTNGRAAKGFVRVDICPQDKFLKDGCIHSASAPARFDTTVVTVPDVPAGRYAAQIFLDENGNGKVDQALFGIPKEGVGFSNDAKIRLGPPKWEEAMFVHNGNAQTIRIRLRYMMGAKGPQDGR
jgi:uncharacterized protein (DUF2141 family)